MLTVGLLMLQYLVFMILDIRKDVAKMHGDLLSNVEMQSLRTINIYKQLIIIKNKLK